MSALSEYIETIPLADLPALIATLSDDVLLEIIHDSDLGSDPASALAFTCAVRALDDRRIAKESIDKMLSDRLKASEKFWEDVHSYKPDPDRQDLADGSGSSTRFKP